MSAAALLAIGEHLELTTRLIRSHARAAQEGRAEPERLLAALSRSSAALGEECASAPPPAACAPPQGDSKAGSSAPAALPHSDCGGWPGCRRAPPPIEADAPTSPRGQPHCDDWHQRREGREATDSSAGVTECTSPGGSGARERKAAPKKATWFSVSGNVTFFQADAGGWRRRSSNRFMRIMESAMESQRAEGICACLILLNLVAMALEGQLKGAQIGHEIGFHSYYGSSDFFEETSAPTPDEFLIVDVIFAVLFTVELILRLVFLRCDFLCDPWGWLDMVVVLVTDLILIADITSMNLSVFRVLRLARLLRIVKLARTIQAFDSLYLMTTALASSMSVLMWVVVLLVLIQTLFALLLTNIVQDFYLSSSVDGEGILQTASEKQEVYVYFGTYWRAMVSLFELMLANWPPICRMMMDTMHELWSVFALGYKLIMGFAVVGVIFGVFTQETFRAAETDDHLMLKKKASQARLHKQKMKLLYEKMATKNHDDVDGDIDLKQFKKVLQHPEFQMWLKAMDYDIHDASLLFYLIDTNEDGKLSVDELIDGMASLKGGARNIDVKLLMRQSLMGRMQRISNKEGLSAVDALRLIETPAGTPSQDFSFNSK